MGIIKSYINGLRNTRREIKMVLVIYFLTLSLALLVVFPFKNMISDSIGHSMSTYELFSEFDYTAYKDFQLQNVEVIKYFQKQIIWFGLFYLLSSIFFAGGILSTFDNRKTKFSLKSFFGSCGEYFSRFLRLGVFSILLQILIAVIIYSTFRSVFFGLVDSIKSEVDIITTVAIAIVIHVMFVLLLMIISDYAKIIIVQNKSTKVLRSYGEAIKFTFKNFMGTYSLYLFLLSPPILLILSYFTFELMVGMVSTTTIILMFLIQQMFIWLRIFIKVWFFASQYFYYSISSVPEVKVIEPILISESEEWNLDDLNEPNTG
jgi:hypothetical protein